MDQTEHKGGEKPTAIQNGRVFFPTLFISLMLNSIGQDRRGVDSNFSQHLPQVGINALY